MPTEVRLLKQTEVELLSQVVDLADKNRAYLGFMPEQTFGPFARNGQIIIAIENGKVLGYILYRQVASKQSAAIVHLCVDVQSRGKNISGHLFDFLKLRVKDASFISLKCRGDYWNANQMWNRLGFIPREETRGRSVDGTLLTIWYYYFGNRLELFEKPLDDDKLDVVIDANVFFDLADTENLLFKKESHSLTADWLLDDVSLCITDEIYREIHRNGSSSLRASNRKAARDYRELNYNLVERDAILSDLKQLMPRKLTPNNLSDLTHLANSIAAKARYFITQDAATIEQSQVLSEKYGLLVRRPVDLIIDIDELRNNKKYVESKFIEHKTLFSSIKASDIPLVVHDFVSNKTQEKLKDLRTKIRLFISEPEQYKSELWKGKGAGNLPHFVIVWHESEACLEVDLLRCKEGFSRLIERKIKSLILDAASKSLNFIKISDRHLSEVCVSALMDYHFFNNSDDNCWYKFLFDGVKPVGSVVKLLGANLSEFASLPYSLKNLLDGDCLKVYDVFDAERFLWPGKIEDAKVPCYIIPIQPRWARSLFDEKMSEQDLFGFDASLLLSRRNVYYRAARPKMPTEGRILWYISKGTNGKRQGYIGASSYVDKISISSAKVLFRKYESLGVYKWRDIYSLAKNDAHREIMSFEFSDTELFKKPLNFSDLQTLFVLNGRSNNQIAAPVEISHDLFMLIYTAAR